MASQTNLSEQEKNISILNEKIDFSYSQEKKDELIKKAEMGQVLIDRLANTKNRDGKAFELICSEILNFVFKEYMLDSDCITTQVSNEPIEEDGKPRIIDIRLANNPKAEGFFKQIQEYKNEKNPLGYNAKTVVVECKYYSARLNKVSRKEIYQLFDYLGDNGKFGIIINKYGYEGVRKNTFQTLKRLLHHDGYMIIILGTKELVDLINSSISSDVDGFFYKQHTKALDRYRI